ncbi:MAG TPA: MFS transporter [Sphingomonas sanguinis]|uniref:MFS transporter n=1 Tax=Sphingomonas sanguinis TaxID=33051 RepID=UPI002ABF9C03|nr:MFS transporter [Sphingomonas sanguinis]
MRTDDAGEPSGGVQGIGTPLTALFATAVGVIVLALYASQPLVGIIGPELGLSPGLSGLATTLTLLGYATGLFLLVPLTDIVENRKLILATLVANICALSVLAFASTATIFLIASFLVGLSTSAIQMLVPVAAALSSEAQRGRTVGNVMSGLMLGILFSRPVASIVTEAMGWRALYGLLGFTVATLAVVLALFVPTFRPLGKTSYLALIGSLGSILKEEPVLRRRAASQAMCMATFSIFWTAIALRLAEAPFTLGQTGIALFALAGAAGAVIAPIAGRAGDRGFTRQATTLAHAAVIAAMILAYLGGSTHIESGGISLALLVIAAVLLDLGVIADQTLGRRAINLLRPEARGRMNGLFTGLFFLGGAAGSALSGVVWTVWEWQGVCAAGLTFGLAAVTAALIGRSTQSR